MIWPWSTIRALRGRAAHAEAKAAAFQQRYDDLAKAYFAMGERLVGVEAERDDADHRAQNAWSVVWGRRKSLNDDIAVPTAERDALRDQLAQPETKMHIGGEPRMVMGVAYAVPQAGEK